MRLHVCQCSWLRMLMERKPGDLKSRQVDVLMTTRHKADRKRQKKNYSVGMPLLVNYDSLQRSEPAEFVWSVCFHHISSQKSFQKNLENTNLKPLAVTRVLVADLVLYGIWRLTLRCSSWWLFNKVQHELNPTFPKKKLIIFFFLN